jgi:hypothetical protein
MFTDDKPAVTAPPRRRWRFWLLAVGVPLGILLVTAVVWVMRTTSALQNAMAEADRLDPRWRMEDIQADRATFPPGQNAADKIIAVKRLKPAGWGPNQKLWDMITDLPAERRITAEQAAELGKALADVQPALAEAQSLIDTPRGRHPVTYNPDWISTLLPTIQTNREAVTLLKFDAIAKAEAGDVDGAVRDAHAALHAAGALGDEPNAIAQLVRIACQAIAINMIERALAQGEPSEAVLAPLQARLEEFEREPLFLYAMRGERAGIHMLFDSLRDGTMPAGSLAGMANGGSNYMGWLLRIPGFANSQEAGLFAFMNEQVEAAKLPPEQWDTAFGNQAARVAQLPILARLLVPAGNKMAEACKRNHATMRCAIVLVAAERFRRKTGQWPKAPDEIVAASVLKAVPGDPYANGQQIKLARTADGLIVYSTGPDGVDDGGKLDRSFAPNRAGVDWGLKLWDVAQRRQPPLPPKP